MAGKSLSIMHTAFKYFGCSGPPTGSVVMYEETALTSVASRKRVIAVSKFSFGLPKLAPSEIIAFIEFYLQQRKYHGLLNPLGLEAYEQLQLRPLSLSVNSKSFLQFCMPIFQSNSQG